MKNKIQLLTLNHTEWPRMEQHFEAMAQQGWLITKIWGGLAIYTQTQPADLTFSIAVYPEAKVFEHFDKKKSKAYADQEAENGWRLAVSKHNLQVFYRPREEEGPALRRDFQVGNIHSHIQLETFSFVTLLALNLFNAYRLFPPNHHMFYRNLSLSLIVLMPMLLCFFTIKLLANALFIYHEGKGLTLSTYEKLPARLLRFLHVTAYLLGGGITVFVMGMLAMDYVDAGRQMILALLPLIAALGIGFFLRKYFVGKNWDGVQKTLAVLVLVVAVVSAASFFTMNRVMDMGEVTLPQGQVGLRVEDVAPGRVGDYSHYRSSGSLLVPEYYRYHESLTGMFAVNTEVAKARSEKMAAYLYQLHQQEMDKYNYRFTPAAHQFPQFDQAVIAIQFYRAQDGSEGGTLLVRDGQDVISLSVSQDLNDPATQALLAGKVEEIKAN